MKRRLDHGLNLPVPSKEPMGPRTTPRMSGSSAIPRTSSRAATSTTDSAPHPGRKRLWRHPLRAVFQDLWKTRSKKYGGGQFKVPPGGYFRKIDRYSGMPLPEDATGDNVVAEYFHTAKSTNC